MSAPIEQKLDKIPVIRWIMRLLKTLKLPGLEGLTVYDLLEMYVLGLINGAVSIRASAVAFSFFMALFPFLLFIIILIPYIPFEGFQSDF
jgi:membrane protein